MRVPDIRASWAETSEVFREHYGLAQDVFRQHWLPISAAAAGLFCLWRFVRFIRRVSRLLKYLYLIVLVQLGRLAISFASGISQHSMQVQDIGRHEETGVRRV